jgi:hypothetical protein
MGIMKQKMVFGPKLISWEKFYLIGTGSKYLVKVLFEKFISQMFCFQAIMRNHEINGAP